MPKHPALVDFLPRDRQHLLRLRARFFASLKYRLGRLALRARHGTLSATTPATTGKVDTYRVVAEHCYTTRAWQTPWSYPWMMLVLLEDLATSAAQRVK